MKLFANLAIALLVLAGPADAAVTLIREYRLKPPRDRHGLFQMVVTPTQDVLSFVVNEDGKWRLSRVRRWLDKQPIEEALAIPGFARNKSGEWLQFETSLLLSPEGKFVVCIASGNRSSPPVNEDLVSVVDLDRFQLVANLQVSALPEASGGYRLYHLDRRGHLAVNAVTQTPANSEWRFAKKLALLSLPGLEVAGDCEYSEFSANRNSRVEPENACEALVKHAGATSLTEYMKTFVENDEVRQANWTRPPECAFLTYASYLSRDGRFRRELCTDGHRGFSGTFVVSNARENVFSTETGKLLGLVKEPSSHPLQSRFATADGRDYLVTTEDGIILKIYQITE
jgi:hypothetical protein